MQPRSLSYAGGAPQSGEGAAAEKVLTHTFLYAYSPVDWSGKEGRMPEANQSLQTSVRRLRGGESAFSSPGSQVSSPQVLRSERPPGLNMPHPTRPVVIGETLRFTAAVMGQRAAVKRWHTAQTAASPPPFRHSRESGNPTVSFLSEGSWAPAYAGNGYFD